MKYKLVAIDLDDTLLRDDLKISPQTIEAIQEAVKKGVTVTLATGRMFQSAAQYAKEIQLDVPIITYQGALIKNVLSGEVLYERLLPYDLTIQVIQELRQQNKHIQIYLHDELIVESHNKYVEKYSKASNVPFKKVDDLIETMDKLQTKPLKIITIDEPEVIKGMEKEWQKKYGDLAHVTISKPDFLEISHREASKGQAIQYLAKSKGITMDQVIAIGDSYNDRDMIEVAGLGVAMGNGHPDIKALADYVTKTNNDHGVWEVLQKFVLNEE
ncbi:Cof-type HAD-IIB family hydrolase [Tepidibacillus sp. HK-1]|uniref:Cof-type HAD-IIB family hydrolase n=1 Tax=Tepidibacillus sp. HK-1 TaxID=1883407 RepID=UPI000852BABC|nr:Cof-type HAD-IIB family hydrolase [Tepidibacillus sp. HK-1]GBF10602.1 putative phosphatase [Tepidibacillus sp. HK-1]